MLVLDFPRIFASDLVLVPKSGNRPQKNFSYPPPHQLQLCLADQPDERENPGFPDMIDFPGQHNQDGQDGYPDHVDRPGKNLSQ